jgi:hypothetical protein
MTDVIDRDALFHRLCAQHLVGVPFADTMHRHQDALGFLQMTAVEQLLLEPRDTLHLLTRPLRVMQRHHHGGQQPRGANRRGHDAVRAHLDRLIDEGGVLVRHHADHRRRVRPGPLALQRALLRQQRAKNQIGPLGQRLQRWPASLHLEAHAPQVVRQRQAVVVVRMEHDDPRITLEDRTRQATLAPFRSRAHVRRSVCLTS